MKFIKQLIHENIKYGEQIYKLAQADLAKQYRGAALGWLWAIIRPSVTIFVFWFAFSVGLRQGKPVESYPYFLWLIAGLIPWFYIRDMIVGGAGSLRQYKYLITKMKFPILIIPTFVSLSRLITELLLILIMLSIFVLFGYNPTIYWLQLPLYILMMFLFFTMWSNFSGILSAVSKDFLNLVKSINVAIFWLSGILYDVNGIENELIRTILLFNPVTLFINGFRNSLIYNQWFWEDRDQMFNLLIVYSLLLILTANTYNRYRKDIPDLL